MYKKGNSYSNFFSCNGLCCFSSKDCKRALLQWEAPLLQLLSSTTKGEGKLFKRTSSPSYKRSWDTSENPQEGEGALTLFTTFGGPPPLDAAPCASCCTEALGATSPPPSSCWESREGGDSLGSLGYPWKPQGSLQKGPWMHQDAGGGALGLKKGVTEEGIADDELDDIEEIY